MLNASLSNMVGLSFARYAEIISALIASDSVCTHVLGCCLVNLLALIIFVVIVNLAFDHFNCITALTSDNNFIVFNE